MKTLRVATCQYAVEGRISHNLRMVLRQVGEAADSGADVVHFSEAALTGYPGIDMPSLAEVDWDELSAATAEILSAARRHKVWIVVGSSHRLANGAKPHNSL